MSKQNRHAILEPVRFASGGGSIERALSILWRNGHATIAVLPGVWASVAVATVIATIDIAAGRRQ
jgi:hypothetical protein